MSKWLHSLGTVALAAVSIFTPQVQGFIGSHATLSAILAGAWAILGHVLKSPLENPPAVGN